MERIFGGHLEKVRAFLDGAPLFERVEIQHEDVLRDPRAAAERLGEFLGLPLDVESMAAAVEPTLHRNRG